MRPAAEHDNRIGRKMPRRRLRLEPILHRSQWSYVVRTTLAAAVLALAVGTAQAQEAVVCVNCQEESSSWLQSAAEIAKWVKQEASMLQAYLLQVEQYSTEVQMFINWVHMPTLGGALGLMQIAGLGTYLPVQPMAMLGLINGLQSAASGHLSIGGIGSLFGSLNALTSSAWTTNHIYTPIDGGWESQQINAGAASIAGMQGAGMNAYQGYQNHMATQQSLRDHLLGLESPKDVADTQAQIALEQAWTENQNGQMLSTMATYTAQRDSREQREIEGTTQSMDNFIAACGCIQ
jgi:Type IV secretion system proteins